MEEKDILGRLRKKFPAGVKETVLSLGDEVAVIDKDALLPVMTFLKDKPEDYAMLLDLTCVDYRDEKPRFEMVYHLYSLTHKARLRIKTRLEENDLRIASLTPLWKNANWLEREVFDLFGVHFEGHPDLRRIFMYDGFEGYPLRKDYPLRRSQPLIRLKD
ncbi:MAG: NADH-quinone oxidoreductase subunit C [Candidatus Aminicenantales bacterium]